MSQLKSLLTSALDGKALALTKLVFTSITNFLITTVLVADLLLTVVVSIRLTEGKSASLLEADELLMQAAVAANPGLEKRPQVLQASETAAVVNPMRETAEGQKGCAPKRLSIL